MQRNWMRHWMKPVEWSQAVWSRQIPTVCPYPPESAHHTSGERWKVVRNGHGKLRTKTPTQWTSRSGAMPIKSRKSFIKCTESINTTAKAAPVELWRERLEPMDARVHLHQCWRTPTSLGQRIPGQPGALNRLRAQVRPVKSEHVKVGIFKRTRNVWQASGRPCNTYWSAPWWTLPALPRTRQRLTTSPSAVPSIGRGRFDGHTTPGGRTRMMMTSIIMTILVTLDYITKLIKRYALSNNSWHADHNNRDGDYADNN